jgi:mannose PTS system EIIA component
MSSAGETAPARGLVVGHGGMANGMVDAVRRIAGPAADVLVGVSNEGKGPDALRDEIERLGGSGPVVVFTDMQAGSCAMAARLVARSGGQRAVVCGVNLPMLLEFVFHRSDPLEQLVPRLVEQGKSSITSHLPNVDPPLSR